MPSKTTVVRTLGDRLRHIFYWAQTEKPYDHIWDLCCDHGRLGLHLYLNRPKPTQTIHLLDRVPSIIANLTAIPNVQGHGNLHIRCMDACNLVLEENLTKESHLFIIAGVGGETIIRIVDAICAGNNLNFKTSNTHADFILSPNSQAFELRTYLNENHFILKEEAFITDKGRHHEHIFVRKQTEDIKQPNPNAVSIIGLQLWIPLTTAKKQYLQKQMLHYKNCASFKGEPQALLAYNAYRALLE